MAQWQEERIMAAFRFSLEQVLVYRAQLEDKAKSEFGRIQSDFLFEQNHQKEIMEDMYEQEKKMAVINVSDLGERWLIESYLKALRGDMTQSKKKEKTLEMMLQAARAKLALCSKDKMIMEKLKEKHEKAFKLEELQKEQREFDEIASIRFKAPSY